ncbi:MAG: T9SS type A sorting domain-containing protein [Saprospiraceae bacterium]|nr:T9SS type A sorting domain-containing protein [Saprospiraceae bacterium]MCB9328333.1 T9SS type A sorting domain-containing protein [Lewinellaceae bacterium]
MRKLFTFIFAAFLFSFSTPLKSQCTMTASNTAVLAQGDGTCNYVISGILDASNSNSLGKNYTISPTNLFGGTFVSVTYTVDDPDYPMIDYSLTFNAPCGGGIISFDLFYDGNGSHDCTASSGAVILPVELIKFTVNQRNSVNELYWLTASETNNSHFDVEQSFDGVHFQKIGSVQGKGNSNRDNEYHFYDDAYLSVTYYRLKQVDYDGRFEYSETIMSVRDDMKRTLTVFPTYFSDELNVLLEENSHIQIFNMSGKIVLEAELHAGKNVVNTSALSAGMYLIGCTDSRSNERQKVIKI